METLRKPWTRGFIFLGIRMIALLSLLCGCIVQADEDADENRRKLSLYFEGEDIYQQSCLPCHGPRGKGDGPWAEGWTNCGRCHIEDGKEGKDDTPVMASQWLPYMQMQMADYLSGKRKMPEKMKEKVDPMSKEDLEALLHFYASVK